MIAYTFIVATCLATTVYALPTSRVVGGQDAPNGAYLYQVSLQFFGSHFCAGTIISKYYILTAAHCIKPYVGIGIDIYAGTNVVTEPGQYRISAELIPHPGYDSETHMHDIGLIRLTRPFIFNKKVQPVKLSTNESLDSNLAVVLTGWGKLSADSSTPLNLQELHTQTIGITECRKQRPQVDISQICGYAKVGEGACMGDSGGPIVTTSGEQVGVLSYVRPCGVGFPDVYARVSYYTNWIFENTQ